MQLISICRAQLALACMLQAGRLYVSVELTGYSTARRVVLPLDATDNQPTERQARDANQKQKKKQSQAATLERVRSIDKKFLDARQLTGPTLDAGPGLTTDGTTGWLVEHVQL